MANIDIERRAGLSSSVAVKGPCRVATTANITLSGLQTIDTVATAEFDRVLVKNQTDAKLNGIYEASTGEWQRTPDFRSNRDVVNGTRVYVTSGAVGSGDWVVDAADPITFDVDDISFTYFNLDQVDAGLVEVGSGWKLPCAVATTANITLSGLQTINGLPVVAGDRVLVADQSNAAENGIWVVSAGAWSRAPDASREGDFVHGSVIQVNDGATSLNAFYKVDIYDAGDYVPGVTEIYPYRLAASTSVAGTVKLDTTTDVLTGTDAAKAVTSDALYALWGKGIDVASASTLTLGEGKLFNVTGTATITDIDFAVPTDGREATLIFEGDLTLTHNGTTLRLPGNANISVKAGDRCDIVQDDADNIFVVNYTPAAAAPFIANSWTPTLTFGGGSTGIVYTTRSGWIASVGDLVVGGGRITLSNKGSSTGNAAISGLTHTSSTFIVGSLPFYTNMSGMTVAGLFAAAGATSFEMFTGGAASSALMTNSSFTNTSDIAFFFSYRK